MEPLTAREHALRASWLLADTDPNERQLDLARSHALVSLALSMSEEDPTPDDAQAGRFEHP